MRIRFLTLAAIASAIAVGFLAAPARAAAQRDDDEKVVRAGAFLKAAAAANRFEIITGQLAQQRGQAAAIKELGAMFAADHTAALQKGSEVARQLGITVPERLDRRQRATISRLERLSGQAFDVAWLKAQARAHEQSLVLHIAGAVRGSREEVRTLAQGALPVITKHLAALFDLARRDRGRT